MPRRSALDPRRARRIAELMLDARAGDRPRRGGGAADGDPEDALIAARRLALRPQGHADRRRAACVRRARDDAAPSEAARATSSRGDRAACCRRARRPPRRRPAPAARRRAGGSTCCRPGATSIPSIRARADPHRLGPRPARRRSFPRRAMCRTTANGRAQVVFDLWGSATMRTGGEDLAQALCAARRAAAVGRASNRVSGYEVLPLGDARPPARRRDACASPACSATCSPCRSRCSMRRPRRSRRATTSRETTIRCAGGATRAHVRRRARRLRRGRRARGARAATGRAATISAKSISPRRASPMAARASARDASGFRDKRGAGAGVRPCAGHGRPGPARFRRLRRARGRLRRRRRALGGNARALSSRRDVARTAEGAHARPGGRRARCAAAPPIRAWFEGQMRHGHRGAAEIAETVDNLFCFAATTDVVAEPPFRPVVRRGLRR